MQLTVVPAQTIVSEVWQNFKFKDQTCINDFIGDAKENIQKLIIVFYTPSLKGNSHKLWLYKHKNNNSICQYHNIRNLSINAKYSKRCFLNIS